MIRGAVLYGGLMYLLSGAGSQKQQQQQQFDYQDQQIEF
jgi:hypothetical protein